MKKLEIKDFLDYDYLSDVKLSKDKKHVVLNRYQADLKENKYKSDLFQIDTDTKLMYQITENEKIDQYLFDSKNNLLYLKKQKDEDLIKIKSSDRKIDQSFYKTKDVIKFFKEIDEDLFLIATTERKTEEEEKEKKENSYYQHVTTLPFWFNSVGFNEYEKVFFNIYDSKKKTSKLVKTVDEYSSIGVFDITRDYFVYAINSLKKGLMGFYDNLEIINLKDMSCEKLLEQKYSISNIAVFDKSIVFVGSDMKKYGINEDSFIYRYDLETKELKKLSDDSFDVSFGNSVGTDIRLGNKKNSKKENEKLYFIITEKNKGKLCSVDAGGNFKIEIENHSIDDFDIVGDDICYLNIDPEHISNIYLNDKKLYEQNPKCQVMKPESFEFISNGDTLTGFVIKPVDFDENKKYPALLSIHGGPKTVFSDIFHHEHQVYANNGYFVIYTNPHGSSSFGVKFSDIRGKYGSIDYEDLMNFTNEAIKRYPQIDEDNMGVLGGSYGGFMTNWIIGHTDRFKAANSQRSISNWTSFYGVSDIGYYFAKDQTDSTPWENFDRCWNLSPLKYALNAKTPTLFIHADCDFRCPLEQGIQMYTALKHNKVDTELYIFKDENHELSRSGKPKARIKRMSAILNWFNTYLK